MLVDYTTYSIIYKLSFDSLYIMVYYFIYHISLFDVACIFLSNSIGQIQMRKQNSVG